MEVTPTPHKVHVFVCTNARHDGNPSCGDAPETGELALKLKERLKELKCPVRLTRSGCLGPCAQGPNIMVYPHGLWFHHVSPDDLDEVVQRLTELAGSS